MLIHNTLKLVLCLISTTKLGGLPNISYIIRKPQPLGTEFKHLVCGMSGLMLWLEIQEGKERMRKKEYIRLGATAACVMRGVTDTCNAYSYIESPEDSQVPSNDRDESEPAAEEARKRLYLADSWFGSVKTAENVMQSGHHCTMIIKTAHSRSPKKWLDQTMNDMPGGTWIVLEGTTEELNCKLVCIGYKYNKKTVLTFVLTRGAGSSEPGDPYEARFPDKYGNLCVRHVARPQVISNYFKYSNKVDIHNQVRQFDIGLEKKWITPNPYFRLYTTQVGMNLTDSWKAFKRHHKDGGFIPSATEFSDITAYDMIQEAKILKGSENNTPSEVSVANEESTTSSLSCVPCDEHTMVILDNKRQVRCVWCSRVNLIQRKVTMICKQCDVGFCRATSGRECWSHHVAMNGLPLRPKKGTTRLRPSEVEE